MAKIEIMDEQPLNITLTEPQTINSSVNVQENVNVTSTDGWYEREYTETDPVYSQSPAADITNADIENWNSKSEFSGDYDDLTNKPTIPSKTSDLTNDSGFLTEHQDISGKVDKEEGKGLSSNDFTDTYKGNVDSNTSARHTHSNKSVLDDISSSDVSNWDSKQETLVSGTNIKTINNTSLLGSGNITIEGGGGTATDVQINGTSITSNDVANIVTEGTYNASTNKIATKSDIPTKTSDLTNDSGFITSYTETDPTVPNHVKSITSTDITNWNNKSTFSGSYNDLSDKPTIPTKTSDITNDSGFITSTNYASNQTGGTIKTDTSTYGTSMYSGYLTGSTRTYTQYGNAANALFVSKGTLENVITGKGLVSNNDLSTVATSGSYTDLTNKPTIPTNLSSFTDDLGNSPTHTHNQYLTSHQDISGKQDTLVSGTNIKTINSQSLLGSGDITISVPGCKEYFGECTTSASTKNKVVDCTGFVLEDGAHIRVSFWYGQTAVDITLNVNNTGAKSIYNTTGSPPRYIWQSGEVIDFTYLLEDDVWVMHRSGIADTTYYGLTKLSSSTSSTSTTLAATPSAVKQAYDLANSKQDAITSTNKLDYSLIDNVPTIPTVPTNLSSFTDDLGSSPTHTHSQYLTSHQDISGKADIEDIPTKVSDLTNDSGFIDSSYHDSSKQNILVSGTNIKTINNESLLGSGDISITSRKDIITATLSADITISTGGAYVDVPLNSNVSVGSGLTFSGGGVVIGSGITKVKTSAKITLPSNKMTTGGKNIVIRKNGSTIVDRNWLSINTVGNNSLVLPSKLIEVHAGDVLKLGYYGAANDGINGGVYTHLTVEAVEYE